MSALKSEFLRIMQERALFTQCTQSRGGWTRCLRGKKSRPMRRRPVDGQPARGAYGALPHAALVQACGHTPIVLIGGVTGMIGDPTGKDDSRKMLTEETTQHKRRRRWRGSSINSCPAPHRQQRRLLRGINYIDFLRDYGSHFSINRMLSMGERQAAARAGAAVQLPRIQLHDLAGLTTSRICPASKNCRLQVSGADQWGNIIQGVELGGASTRPSCSASPRRC